MSGSRNHDKETHMLDSQLALSAYLDALLQPAVDTEEVTPRVITTVPVIAPPVIAPPQPIPEPEPQSEPVVEPVPVAQATAEFSEPPAEGRPAWASEPFQVLLFRVAGLQLAVPLVALNGVIPWNDGAVTEMPNHRDWFLGLRDHLDQRVKLIDIAAIVLPPERYAALGPADRQRLSKVVLIDNYAWGLACEDVAEVVTLAPDEVKWRTAQSSRTWLAGTVISHMCALLDVSAFADLLRQEGLPPGV
jgi:purine-binding chemotaxis protein CheW